MPVSMLALLDDVASLSKVAMRKTAALSTDDLAVNAGVVDGLNSEREWPIIGQVAARSLVNKALLVPAALLVPGSLVAPILALGGAFLSYEGMAHHEEEESGVACEKTRVREATATDLVLSAEITAVTLGQVSSEPLMVKATVIGAVGLAMTIGVYGTVAVLVKIDDTGRWLTRKGWRGSGHAMEKSSPWIMAALGRIGRLAMLMVGGGLLTHNGLGMEPSWWQAIGVGALVGWMINIIIKGVKR